VTEELEQLLDSYEKLRGSFDALMGTLEATHNEGVKTVRINVDDLRRVLKMHNDLLTLVVAYQLSREALDEIPTQANQSRSNTH
jgi:hypothetical protein